MRSTLLFALIIIGIISCTQQTKPSETKAPEAETSIAESPAGEKDTTSLFYGDSTFYVGYVNYFPETKEYYTQLYFRANKVEDYELLNLLDSTLYEDDETRRRRLPVEEAKKLFVLEGMETLHIYNRRHQLITKATLVRVEKFDETITSGFVAVYKGDEFITDNQEPYYGIAAGSEGYAINNFSAQPLIDKALTGVILDKLAIDTTGLKIEHYRVLPEDCIYSALSTDKVSYITALKDGSLAILQFVDDDTMITGILPVQLSIGDRPALLISMSVRESDYMWDYLAVFEDSKYEQVNRDRIRIK